MYQPRNIGVKEIVKGNIHTLANIKTTVFLFSSKGYSNGRQMAKYLERKRVEMKIKDNERNVKSVIYHIRSSLLSFFFFFLLPVNLLFVALMVHGVLSWLMKKNIFNYIQYRMSHPILSRIYDGQHEK